MGKIDRAFWRKVKEGGNSLQMVFDTIPAPVKPCAQNLLGSHGHLTRKSFLSIRC